MIEVFRTNVKDRRYADMLLNQIHKNFIGYAANFDLDDCDNILRVKSETGSVEASHLIELLRDYGFVADILPEDD